jgi:hypothetical protein
MFESEWRECVRVYSAVCGEGRMRRKEGRQEGSFRIQLAEAKFQRCESNGVCVWRRKLNDMQGEPRKHVIIFSCFFHLALGFVFYDFNI